MGFGSQPCGGAGVRPLGGVGACPVASGANSLHPRLINFPSRILDHRGHSRLGRLCLRNPDVRVGTRSGQLPFPLYSSLLHVALNESMATLKRELSKRYAWKTRLDLELALVTYIGWYNARRRHRSLKIVENGRIRRQTPPQVLERYNQEVAMLAVAST